MGPGTPFITRRDFTGALLLAMARAAAPRTAQAQKPTPAVLPPVSWTCPMHPEVVDDEAALCPICKMKLVPVRLDLVWTCPVHTTVVSKQAGQCRTCRRDLVRVVKAMSWTCRNHPKVEEINPGRCPTCKRTLEVRYSDRPHGDHNPKHGGHFIMAPNNWHVEVTHPSSGQFRIYAYDEYSKPFMPRGFTARIEGASAAGRPASQSPVAFTLRRNQPYLDAQVPSLALPAVIVVKVRFQENEPEYRFDFQFYEYSKEPAPPR